MGSASGWLRGEGDTAGVIMPAPAVPRPERQCGWCMRVRHADMHERTQTPAARDAFQDPIHIHTEL